MSEQVSELEVGELVLSEGRMSEMMLTDDRNLTVVHLQKERRQVKHDTTALHGMSRTFVSLSPLEGGELPYVGKTANALEGEKE